MKFRSLFRNTFLVMAAICFCLVGCTATRDVAGPTSEVYTKKSLANLPEKVQNELVKFAADRDIALSRIEFANEFSSKVRLANPSGVNVEKLQKAYIEKDYKSMYTLLGLSSEADIKYFEKKFSFIQSQFKQSYPELYQYTLQNRDKNCSKCASEGGIQRINELISTPLAAKIKPSANIGEFPIIYPSILREEEPPGGGAGGPSGGGPPPCHYDKNLKLLACTLESVKCVYDATQYPEPINYIAGLLCAIDYGFCVDDANNCR